MAPFLPGSRPKRLAPLLNDRTESYDREALQNRILAALAAGPLKKQQVCEAVHAGEEKVLIELKTLRRTGAVKRAGSHRGGQWALASWRAHSIPKTTPNQHMTAPSVVARRPPPRTSWWANAHTREEFSAAAAARERELRAGFGPIPFKGETI